MVWRQGRHLEYEFRLRADWADQRIYRDASDEPDLARLNQLPTQL